jgi:hypothetical protein
MANFIVKLAEGKYIEWSTVCDAPASSVMSEDECKSLMMNIEIDKAGLTPDLSGRERELKQELVDLAFKNRWERVNKTGTSP